MHRERQDGETYRAAEHAPNHNKTAQAARLKETRTIVTGISEAVAETIVDLGVDWGGIETLSDLRSGLKAALRDAQWRVE